MLTPGGTSRHLRASGPSDVMPQKGLDHCVHLIGNFELIEMSGTDSPAIDDARQPLRHQMRWIARRCCCQMEGRHLALGGNGTTVEFESPPL